LKKNKSHYDNLKQKAGVKDLKLENLMAAKDGLTNLERGLT
jgi:hypothetical protein